MSMISSQSVTVILSILAISTNALAALLFHQLPADPYHIALAVCIYSQFACALSVLGLNGALREHASSVAIFANYLILDTVLCSIPRFVLMTMIAGFGSFLCHPKSTSTSGVRGMKLYLGDRQELDENLPGSQFWPRQKCQRAVSILSMMAFVTLIGMTVVQLVLALQVRAYSSRLWREKRKTRESSRGEMQVYESLLT